MTRPWGKVHGSMLNHPKFLRSTPEERGAWLTLFLYALNSPTDADLGTVEDVVARLRREGFRKPEPTLGRLVELHWLDEDRNRYAIHDWNEWQPDDPTGARRKRAIRDLQVGTGRSEDDQRTVAGRSPDIPRTIPGQSSARGEKKRFLPHPPQQNGQEANGGPSYDDLLIGDDRAETSDATIPGTQKLDPGISRRAGSTSHARLAVAGDRR